jgi:hypothetical protein
MKKRDSVKINYIRNKRNKKTNKRNVKSRRFKGKHSSYTKELQFRITKDQRIISSTKSVFWDFICAQEFIDGQEDKSLEIHIPQVFSLKRTYSLTVKTIKDIIASMMHYKGKEIIINFNKCIKVDHGALFFLQILRLEVQLDLRKLNSKLRVLSTDTTTKIIKSINDDVNLNLFLLGFISEIKLENNIEPIHSLGFLKGTKSRTDIIENRKGIITSNIVNYLDNCLNLNNLKIKPQGKNKLSNMIGEILNNAEDHGIFNNYFVTANYHIIKNPDIKNNVGILFLSFLNFGPSIYDGIENNKEENREMYNRLEDEFLRLNDKHFTKENIFTLYALQDGVSRLKYQNSSRGSGTMTFINSFYDIGDYENGTNSITPHLSIFSGKTHVFCTKDYRPYTTTNGNSIISLNDSNDLRKPPNKNNLKLLTEKFPGTILTFKFCLNRHHIEQKLANNGSNTK